MEKFDTLPNITKPIGIPFVHYGKTLVAIERPDNLKPHEACMGCYWFPKDRSCPKKHACSSFDREDGKNVWFQEVTQ